MSAFSKVKMSYSKVAIIAFSKGGSYGRKGHGYHESRGAEADKYNPQGDR
jgi:hypothetical protein